MLRRSLRTLPVVIILAALGGTAYLGHATGWKLAGRRKASDSNPVVPPEQTKPKVRLGADGNGGESRIEFADAGSVEAAGIDIATVWQTKLTEQAAAAGEVSFEPTRVARMSARTGGVARRVLKAVGDPVRAGELLAVIDSNELAKAKAEFQQSLVQARLRERARDDLVAAKTATSPNAIREAEAGVNEADVRVRAAAQTLTNLGLPVRLAEYRGLTPADAARRLRQLGAEAATDVDPTGTTTNLLPLKAPFAGVVLTADAVNGEVVESGKVLLTVVDPSRVLITLNVGTEHAKRAAVGQQVFFRPDGGTREYPAVVVSVGTVADETTRTVPVRAEAENAEGHLRASTLGRGRIVFREVAKALVVPREAVHQFQGRSVVFVRASDYLRPGAPKAFDVQVVRAGGQDEQNTEILDGLSGGEVVAAKGSGGLLNELKLSTSER